MRSSPNGNGTGWKIASGTAAALGTVAAAVAGVTYSKADDAQKKAIANEKLLEGRSALVTNTVAQQDQARAEREAIKTAVGENTAAISGLTRAVEDMAEAQRDLAEEVRHQRRNR